MTSTGGPRDVGVRTTSRPRGPAAGRPPPRLENPRRLPATRTTDDPVSAALAIWTSVTAGLESAHYAEVGAEYAKLSALLAQQRTAQLLAGGSAGPRVDRTGPHRPARARPARTVARRRPVAGHPAGRARTRAAYPLVRSRPRRGRLAGQHHTPRGDPTCPSTSGRRWPCPWSRSSADPSRPWSRRRPWRRRAPSTSSSRSVSTRLPGGGGAQTAPHGRLLLPAPRAGAGGRRRRGQRRPHDRDGAAHRAAADDRPGAVHPREGGDDRLRGPGQQQHPEHHGLDLRRQRGGLGRLLGREVLGQGELHAQHEDLRPGQPFLDPQGARLRRPGRDPGAVWTGC